MNYREPLVTKEMQYPQLSRRVKNMTNFLLFLDVTISRFQKLKPIISEPLLLFFFNLSWHIFYATRGLNRLSGSAWIRISLISGKIDCFTILIRRMGKYGAIL